ncbi:dolichyl pyrophosphate Man9GlcNAc2 alpha-1,3-glucosyltransferase-like isoform X2 [Varroa destructor]|uniref:Alpha-1,3-glucosyltransferase n=1 Tax=Varroa destructor TaxID=109461 RepID=A0A7M7JW87_VARDE|nr:dolichyl pyrophosphate Man9GlcNAc2 alpha-1,3-glucosyltransferase-like isoform X2 [Varroa destructor]
MLQRCELLPAAERFNYPGKSTNGRFCRYICIQPIPMMELDVLLSAAVMWSILLRLLTSLFPYSGMGKPPMYGDFEAQRHWMEVTTQLPLKEWYVNSTRNDLMYWGLDYPPLTAYHSWLCGKISEQFNLSWTALNSSRGHESPEHKLFMRWSVLASDFVVFYPSVLYFGSLYNTKSKMATAIWALLINPAMILVDHGHFQYNGVCLGLFVLTVALAKRGRYALAAIAFSLSLNFKQIALYFAMPVFIHLLKACIVPSLNLSRFLHIAIATLGTFGIVWVPFAWSGGQQLIEQILYRIFPLQRGLFEDKVANFWYVTSVLVKYKKLFKSERLVQIAFGATLFFSLPSWIMLWAQGRNSQKKICNFKLALVRPCFMSSDTTLYGSFQLLFCRQLSIRLF